MPSHLPKELRQKDNGLSLPVLKEDEVHAARGHHQEQHTDKAAQVLRKAYAICTARAQQDEADGTSAHVGFHPSKATMPRPKLDKDCKETLQCKVKSHQVGREEGKYRKKQLRRCRNHVILYTDFIKSELHHYHIWNWCHLPKTEYLSS